MGGIHWAIIFSNTISALFLVALGVLLYSITRKKNSNK